MALMKTSHQKKKSWIFDKMWGSIFAFKSISHCQMGLTFYLPLEYGKKKMQFCSWIVSLFHNLFPALC